MEALLALHHWNAFVDSGISCGLIGCNLSFVGAYFDVCSSLVKIEAIYHFRDSIAILTIGNGYYIGRATRTKVGSARLIACRNTGSLECNDVNN